MSRILTTMLIAGVVSMSGAALADSHKKAEKPLMDDEMKKKAMMDDEMKKKAMRGDKMKKDTMKKKK